MMENWTVWEGELDKYSLTYFKVNDCSTTSCAFDF